jgi:hypothetical protein
MRRPNHTLFKACAILAVALSGPRIGHATLIELTSRPATGDTVYWNQIAPQGDFTALQPFTSTGGITGSISLQGNGIGQIQEQCCIGITGIWDGNFAPGDFVLATHGTGPLTISFDTPMRIVGAQVQADALAPFTAQIQAYHNNLLLGSFTEDGNSTSTADNSAIFLGVEDDNQFITSVVYSLTFSADPNPAALLDLGINQMTIEPRVVPEPSSLALFLAGLLVSGICAASPLRRKFGVLGTRA